MFWSKKEVKPLIWGKYFGEYYPRSKQAWSIWKISNIAKELETGPVFLVDLEQSAQELIAKLDAHEDAVK